MGGLFIPEGTGIRVNHYVANHSHENFDDWDMFAPERWMVRSEDDVGGER